MTQTINGVLEVDAKRGVIYFHSLETTVPTVLRICRLGVLPKLGEDMFDITHMIGHNAASVAAVTETKQI